MAMRQSIYEKENISLSKYNLALNETLFHNANGYIGVRYDFEEGSLPEYNVVPSQYINGFYDFTPMKQAENLYGLVREKQIMLNTADTQTIKLFIGREQFSMFRGTVLKSKLWLDMDKGITVRHVLWRSPEGKELEIKITRMTSFHQLPLFTIQYEVLPLNFSGSILLESGHNGNVFNYANPDDPRIADESFQYLNPVSCEIREGASFITSVTSKSELKICSGVINILSQDNHRQQFIIDNNNAICKLHTEALKGEKIELIKYAVFCDSIRYNDCMQQAALELKNAQEFSLPYLYQKQEEYLKNYWDNCLVEIEGDEESNLAIRYSMYQLIQSVGKDCYSNIAPKGLSGDGYEGHFFWDSEMYVQPFFSITHPSISKKLIENRYQALEEAKENARILGHSKGALFPWRTIMGKECSGYFPSGSAQYHINGAVAYAIIFYYLATKDLLFMLEKGAEIIWETARLWLDTGNFYEDKFQINDVTGPDEYTCIVNNNYYTNVLAQYHLRWAVKLFELLNGTPGLNNLLNKIELKESEIAEFQEAADKMYLPYDPKLKINPQDDSFLQKREWDISALPKEKFPLLLHYHPLHLYRHQVSKQPDTVLAHFILEDAQSEETILNSYVYYEKITTHCSSLSSCIFSIMAARLGMVDKALSYYEMTAKLDLLDMHHNTIDGIHAANMGGNYMAVVYGFGGFRLKERGISFAPVLPDKWKGFSFRISFEDSKITVRVTGQECIITLDSGSPKEIWVYEKKYLLDRTLYISRA